MWRGVFMRWSVAGLVALLCVLDAAAGDPIFVQWMNPDKPGDRVILAYWERAEADKLTPEELIDLGTMLFRRGFPNDAQRYFRQSLDLDKNMAEAWYRIGLVDHEKGELRLARQAYERCLKLMSGHGWCNFYMGLLEEQAGNPHQAMDHFIRAFRSAPELSDAKVNPEMLYSKLAFGAMVMIEQETRFEDNMPMPLLEPKKVDRETRRATSDRPTDPVPKAAGEPSAVETKKSPKPQASPTPATVAPVAPPPAPAMPVPTPSAKTAPNAQEASESALQGLRKMTKPTPAPAPKRTPNPNQPQRVRRGYHPGAGATPPPTPTPTPKG